MINEIELINKYSQSEIEEKDVFLFSLILCDNDLDRDGEAFSIDSLNKLKELFVGKTGLFDHSCSAKDQSARVISTEIEEDENKLTAFGDKYVQLKARAYMMRTKDNESLIKEIEGGIKKEVSVSVSVKSKTCSICGKEHCAHVPGREYRGKMCYIVLDGPTDAYEWSFVAVPAQRQAGVSKNYDAAVITKHSSFCGGNMTLVENEKLERIKAHLERAEESESYLEEKRKEYEQKLILALKIASGDLPAAESVLKFAKNLSMAELEEYCKSMLRLTGLEEAVPQLAAQNTEENLKFYK